MREILFRGKFGEEWKYGYLSVEPKGLVIKEPYELNQSNIWHIDSETIGQYTGLVDKNGNKIFEGDIVKYLIGPAELGYTEFEYGEINYRNVGFEIDGEPCDLCVCSFDSQDFNLEVIGNIHDNPELLKG